MMEVYETLHIVSLRDMFFQISLLHFVAPRNKRRTIFSHFMYECFLNYSIPVIVSIPKTIYILFLKIPERSTFWGRGSSGQFTMRCYSIFPVRSALKYYGLRGRVDCTHFVFDGVGWNMVGVEHKYHVFQGHCSILIKFPSLFQLLLDSATV